MIVRATVAAVAMCCAWLPASGRFCCPPALAQQQPYSPPRDPDGAPDFSGLWTNSTEVEIERPDGVAELVISREACDARKAAAPPMTSQGYDDAYQIVQTATYVAIAVEMMHETRIVPVFKTAADPRKAHGPPMLQRWTGDPVGRREGDTLVVETENINVSQGGQSATPMSGDGKVVERFKRISAGELLYQAEVTDPVYYSRPWKLETSFRPTPRSFEYACHEGNFWLVGILSGARKAERDQGQRKSVKVRRMRASGSAPLSQQQPSEDFAAQRGAPRSEGVGPGRATNSCSPLRALASRWCVRATTAPATLKTSGGDLQHDDTRLRSGAVPGWLCRQHGWRPGVAGASPRALATSSRATARADRQPPADFRRC